MEREVSEEGQIFGVGQMSGDGAVRCVCGAGYKQQRTCYGQRAVLDAGLACFGGYSQRLVEISRRGATASTRAVAVSICRLYTPADTYHVHPSVRPSVRPLIPAD